MFDLEGNYINRFPDTSGIASMFPDVKRKTILSQLNKKIDSNIPYKNIYISSSRDFKVPKNYKPRYKEPDQLDVIFASNPIIYVYDYSNKLVSSKHLFDFDKPYYVKKKIRNGSPIYRLEKDCIKFVRGKSIEVKVNGEIRKFKSAVEASYALFGDIESAKNICKHVKRNTPYKGYYFKRVL